MLDLRGGESDGAMRYTRERTNVDLYDLSRRISECERLPNETRDAAKGVMNALERFMISSFGMSGYKGFEADRNGVYIVLPSGEPGCWKNFAWYTPNAGMGRDYGRWSFLKRDAPAANGGVTNWYDLMVSWFDEGAKNGGKR